MLSSRVKQLFGSEKHKFLQRMMKVERSAHVKQQVRALEGEVLRAQKTYNEVRTEREKREKLLKKLDDTRAFLGIGDKAVQTTDHLLSLEEKLRKAKDQLERETAMTETLEHMIADRRKEMAIRVQPTVPMQQKLKSVMALNEGNLGNLTKAALEIETRRARIKTLQQHFIKQKNSHSGMLDALLEQYAYRREFEELSSEHRNQQHLRTRMFIKESSLKRLNFSLAVSTTHESKQREIAEQQAALDRMEVTIDTMTKAAKTDSPNGILEYWHFLKESEEYLKGTASALEDRISDVKQQVEDGKHDYQQEIEALASHGMVPTTITSLEEKQRLASQTIEARQEKVSD